MAIIISFILLKVLLAGILFSLLLLTKKDLRFALSLILTAYLIMIGGGVI